MVQHKNRGRALRAGLWVGVALLLTGATGCVLFVAGAAAGAAGAGVAYVKGALKAHVDHGPQAVIAATDRAFEAMGIRKVSSNASALDGKAVGRTATDTRVEVLVKAAEPRGSDLSIRVGVFGDEALSRRVYDEIQKQLG